MPPLPSPSPAGPLLVGTPHPSAPEEALPRARRLTYWVAREPSLERELAEALLLITAVTVAGWYSPLSYHALGHVYLLTVIVLSLRVGRWPALVAAVVSALAWDYAFIPPKLSFSTLDFDDALLLGTYFVVALTAGQLTTRIREQQRSEHQREQRATALFHLTRALAGTHTLDEGVAAALAQADVLFEAKTALLLVDEFGQLHAHPAGTLSLSEPALGLAGWAWRNRHEAGRFTSVSPEADGIHLPLLRDQQALGVLVIRPPAHATRSTGFIMQSTLIVNTPDEYKRQAVRMVSAKALLAARMDAGKTTSRDGSYGAKLHDELGKKIDKLLEPPPQKLDKVLPVPKEGGGKKRRGGRKARKAKERNGMTELRKMQNRMEFGKQEEEAMGYDESVGLGMINSSASGKVRAQTAEARSKGKISRANKNRLAALRGATAGANGGGVLDGTASSLSFTPVQGIELVDPSKRKSGEGQDAKWFKQGQFSLLPGAKGNLPGSMGPPPPPPK